MKTTKTQAFRIYGRFHAMLRNLNGGTKEENERSAPHCWERLKEIAAEADEAAKNPNKHLANDEWLLAGIKALPAIAAAFGERYGLEGGQS